MVFRSKKIFVGFCIAAAIVAVLAFPVFSRGGEDSCKSSHIFALGDVRRDTKLAYFDVITVEGYIPDIAIVPPGSGLTDDTFSKMALDIFRAEFNKACKDSGVIVGEYGHPYSFDTNPFMVRIIFSLVKHEDGRLYLEQIRQRRKLASWFNRAYDEDADTINGKKIEDVFDGAIKPDELSKLEEKSDERRLWRVQPDQSNFESELRRELTDVSSGASLRSVTGKKAVDKYNALFVEFLERKE